MTSASTCKLPIPFDRTYHFLALIITDLDPRAVRLAFSRRVISGVSHAGSDH